MGELFPPQPAVLRDRYEHVLLRRDGHLLEVTINRPEARNSLHPMANDEQDHVFDAYFSDDDLWAAILTGAGDKAFSAGNDLVYSASRQPMWVPKNGFAGLVRLPRTIPPKVAAEMILTGRRITAGEALGYGLVNRVVAAGTALDGARALAAEILDGSPTSVRISLRLMEEARGIPDPVAAISHPTTAFDDLMASADAFGGPAAFAQKRAPRWRNR
jgi:acetyl-CoA C-acetyltransferase